MPRFMLLTSICALGILLCAAATPTTQPGAGSKILIIPFYQQNSPSQPAWLQNPLAKGLSAKIPSSVSSETPAVSLPKLLEQAKANKANLVIFGTFRLKDESLTVDLQYLDVKTEKTFEGKTYTLALTDLFSLEDQLATECSAWISNWKKNGPESSDPVADFAKKASHPTPTTPSVSPVAKLHPWELPDDEILAAQLRQLNGGNEATSTVYPKSNPTWIYFAYPTSRPSK